MNLQRLGLFGTHPFIELEGRVLEVAAGRPADLREEMGKMSVFFLCAAVLVFVFVSADAGVVGVYELKRGNFSVKFTNWGATIVSLVLPDKNGNLADVVLGYDTIKEYMNDTGYLGSIVGRVANRIAGAQFTLNGTRHRLPKNEGKNMLHGGPRGFSDVAWKVTRHYNKGHSPHVVFSYYSQDGEEGFPGALQVTVAYTLVGGHQFSVAMKAKALNKPTPVNLAQHTYWNLGGHNSGKILSSKVKIFGSRYTPLDKHLIPTGKVASVKGTPYDFLKRHAVGSRIKRLPHGYDINYVLDGEEGGSPELERAAIVYEKRSGRTMELRTNAPGLQFYTANHLKNVKGKGGSVYKAQEALCLETQGFPDSVNHPNFPSQIVVPGKDYAHFMLFKFSTK